MEPYFPQTIEDFSDCREGFRSGCIDLGVQKRMPDGILFCILATETDVANEVRLNNHFVIVSRPRGFRRQRAVGLVISYGMG